MPASGDVAQGSIRKKCAIDHSQFIDVFNLVNNIPYDNYSISGKDSTMFERRSRGGFFRLFITSIITSALVGVVLFFAASNYIIKNISPQLQSPQIQMQSSQSQQSQQLQQSQQTAGTDVLASRQLSSSDGQTIFQPNVATNVAKSASSGVVGISVYKIRQDSLFSQNSKEISGMGSGVIVSHDGYILTNDHVAGNKQNSLTVSLADGRAVAGTTIWSDPVLDLAVVKIDAAGLAVVPMGDANSLQVGDTAIAIGNPLGLELQRTVTSGIISAMNRTIRIQTDNGTNYMEDLIQTDAGINPGNSGGPLLNAEGMVVGINTMKVASAEAIGFAIPINVAVPVILKLEDTGSFNEPYLGIFAYDKWIIPFIDKTINVDNGIYVSNVDKNSPAYAAGLKRGCIIRQVDGASVNTMLQLSTLLYAKAPGDMISISYMTGDKTGIAQVKLVAKTKDGLLTR